MSAQNNESYELSIDLNNQLIEDSDNKYSFDIDPFRKKCLLEDLTILH